MTVTAPLSRPVRSPLAVRAAAGLVVLLTVVSTFGLIMFGLVWAEGPLTADLLWVAFMLATAATAVAALPSLLRGTVAGWAIPGVWACCYTYWTVYKVFVEGEFESLGFLAAGCGVIALLSTRSARVHAGIAR